MNIKFVCVSKNNESKMSSVDFHQADMLATVSTEFIYNNSSSLASVYNRYLNEYTGEQDYIVFLHSDVAFSVKKFVENIILVSGKYDLIGLCGCSKFIASQTPLNWFCASRPCPETRWGCVSHGELNGQTSFFSSHSPDVTDHEVACIDGLCIVFSRNAIQSGLRFDESLSKFDFYDTDISMQAMIKYKLKIGVIVQRDLMHYSVGKSILSKDFAMSEIEFRKKWKLPLPSDLLSKIQMT